jgi:heparosan-N-sulfate-glucuronate 5-epimerase
MSIFNLMRPYRLFDERAEHLGPYYVAAFWQGSGPRTFDAAGIALAAGVRHPVEIVQYGLEQHARWRRRKDERARDRFLLQAKWAANAQCEIGLIRGCYAFPCGDRRYGCYKGFLSAKAQGQAISLLLRAYEETQSPVFLERAISAAAPFFVDVRRGGVQWNSGDDVFFEGPAALPPSHVLNSWIYALWGLFELARVTNDPKAEDLYARSLGTLEKYLPCYDTGSWSYATLLAAPSGFRRYSSLKRHVSHVAQLHVLLSMTRNELFSVVAERWRRYITSLESLASLLGNAVPSIVLSAELTIPGGARSVV